MSSRYILPGIILVQIILIFIGFQNHYTNPLDSLFHDLYDGFKNYHTLYTYASQNLDDQRLLHYLGMNYPYGEFVTYTDNTPALSIPIKALVLAGLDPGPWIIVFFNQFIIAGILISTVLLFFILRSFLDNRYLIILASLTLPWLNPQLIRLSNGHFNLSLSWLILLPVLLLIVYHKRLQKGKSLMPLDLALLGSLLLSTAFHLYYLPINGLIIGVFLLFIGVYRGLSPRVIISAISIPLAALAIFYILSIGLDPFYLDRPDSSTGFNSPHWRLNLLALFTAYSHFGIDFIVQSIDHHHIESNSYVGAFVLYGTLILVILRYFGQYKFDVQPLLLKAFVIVGSFSIITALGTKFNIPALGIHVENVLNPLFWLKKVSNNVEQFRCLARFNWPFFWCVNFLLLYFMDQAIKMKVGFVRVIAFILPVFLLLDAKDAIRFYHNETYANVLLTSDMTTVKGLTGDLNYDQYEAILPIPYYHVGSMDFDHTIHSTDTLSRRAAQLSAYTGIPLMSSLMSRTPIKYAEQQFNVFLDPDNSALQDLKTNKPLLVLLNNKVLCDYYHRDEVLNNGRLDTLVQTQEDFIFSEDLQHISTSGDFKLMRWFPH